MLLAALNHLRVPTQQAQRPIDQTARVAAIGKDGLQTLKAHEKPHQQSLGPHPVLKPAEGATTANCSPIVSEAMWRSRPLILLPVSYPRCPLLRRY